MTEKDVDGQNVARCLDPQVNILVTACAGSGKTWLLTSRIIRALLAEPRLEVARILAITYTNVAVAEIQERLRLRLGELRLADDGQLDRLLTEIHVRPTARQRSAARGLYSRYALARPSMMVSTFHGWFMHLERSLPWAARSSLTPNVATSDQLVRDEAWQICVHEATAATAPPQLADALRNLLRRHRPPQLQEMLDTMLTQRVAWELRFGKPPEEDRGEFYAAFERDNQPPSSNTHPTQIVTNPATTTLLTSLLSMCVHAPHKWVQNFAPALQQAHAACGARDATALTAALRLALHTKAGTPRKSIVKYFASMGYELDEMLALLNYLIVWESWEETKSYNQAALLLGRRYAACYRDRKQQLGVIDFADIELSSLRAFRTAEPEQIVARMERTYSHILIDEFQDTSPSQWEIMRSWLDACQGGDHEPKVFIVGDPKQSIYGFQGGDPKMLTVAAAYLNGKYRPADGADVTVSFNTTRRCAPQVINIVNKVFQRHQGMKDFVTHAVTPSNSNLPGQVTVLQLATPKEKKKERNHLRNPLEEALVEINASPAALEGQQIAAVLDGIIGKWLVRGDDSQQERPCQPADVMLLYRTRSGATEVAQALVRKGIGCASPGGNNRLHDLECQDIIALLRAICDPANALVCAQVLRAPVFGVSEDDLWAVFRAGEGQGPTRQDDWEYGLRVAQGSPELKRAQGLLGKWRAAYLGSKLPAHETLAQCYQEADVVARYVRAVPRELGKRVVHNLEWLLNHAIEADGGRHAQVAEYADYLAQLAQLDRFSIPEATEDDLVRATTVHGAKGLESPVVVMSNTFVQLRPVAAPGLLVSWSSHADEGRRLPSHISFFWHRQVATPTQLKCLAINEADQQRENLNLLYVALTRAKQVLIISAKTSRSKTLDWYGMLKVALKQLAAKKQDEGNVLYELGGLPAIEPPASVVPPVPAGGVPATVLAAVGTTVRPASPQARRGTLLHGLLVLTLTGITDEPAQLGYLGLAAPELRELRAQVAQILAGPQLAELLRQRRRLELELPVPSPDGKEVLRIDCLLETADALWIIDFKSVAQPEAQQDYRAQLRGYRAALLATGEEDSPRRPIRLGLVGGQGNLTEVS